MCSDNFLKKASRFGADIGRDGGVSAVLAVASLLVLGFLVVLVFWILMMESVEVMAIWRSNKSNNKKNNKWLDNQKLIL